MHGGDIPLGIAFHAVAKGVAARWIRRNGLFQEIEIGVCRRHRLFFCLMRERVHFLGRILVFRHGVLLKRERLEAQPQRMAESGRSLLWRSKASVLTVAQIYGFNRRDRPRGPEFSSGPLRRSPLRRAFAIPAPSRPGTP